MSGQRHKYLKAFNAADRDKSGSLNRAELESVLAANGIPPSEVTNLMDQLDVNGDGIIHLDEYKQALGISTQPVDAWKTMFEELDNDGSGVVDFNEMKVFLKNNNAEDMIPILDDWMSDFDSNNDGKLNYQEFLQFVNSLD